MAEKTITQLRQDYPNPTIGDDDLLIADQSTKTVAIKISELMKKVKPENVLATKDGLMTKEDFAKLQDIAIGATKNSDDSVLLNRANHTGTQSIASIEGLTSALNSRQAGVSMVVSGLDVSVAAGKINISQGKALFVDYTNPQLPVASNVDIPARNSISLIAPNNCVTYIGVNKQGDTVQQPQRFSVGQKSSIVELATIVHDKTGDIRYIVKANAGFGNGLLRVLVACDRPFITSGCHVTVNSDAMTIKKEGGTIVRVGSPGEVISVTGENSARIAYVNADGSVSETVNSVDANNIEENNTKKELTDNYWSIQKFYIVGDDSLVGIRGNKEYEKEHLALNAAASNNTKVPNEVLLFGTHVLTIVLKKGCTDLSDAATSHVFHRDGSPNHINKAIIESAMGFKIAEEKPAAETLEIPKCLKADLPTASDHKHKLILVTDAKDFPKICISNGTKWKILNTNTDVE